MYLDYLYVGKIIITNSDIRGNKSKETEIVLSSDENAIKEEMQNYIKDLKENGYDEVSCEITCFEQCDICNNKVVSIEDGDFICEY